MEYRETHQRLNENVPWMSKEQFKRTNVRKFGIYLPKILAGNRFHSQGRCPIELEGVTTGSEMEIDNEGGVRQHPRGRIWARVKIILPLRLPLTPCSVHGLSLPYRNHHHQALAILCHFLSTYLNFGRKLPRCQKRRSQVIKRIEIVFLDMLVLEEDERLYRDGGKVKKILYAPGNDAVEEHRPAWHPLVTFDHIHTYCPHLTLSFIRSFSSCTGYTCRKATSGHAFSIFGWPLPLSSLPISGA
jgi:hypothetical protein